MGDYEDLVKTLILHLDESGQLILPPKLAQRLIAWIALAEKLHNENVESLDRLLEIIDAHKKSES